MNNLFLICGKSNSGKDTLVNAVMNNAFIKDIKKAVSFTTRPKRIGEYDGVHYNFITEQDFEEKLKEGEILEYESYFIESENTNWLYGSTRSELTKSDNVIAIVNPKGLKSILATDLGIKATTILIECDDRTRLLRALERDSDVKEIVNRFNRDERDFDDMSLYDYKIINENFCSAYNFLTKILYDKIHNGVM